MQAHRSGKRAYGSGSIFEQRGSYYGKWWASGRQVKRKLGPIRRPGTRDGLTKTQAEARLRELMGEQAPPPVAERVTVDDAGRHLIRHLEGLGRKRSTTQGYESFLRVHLVPHFREKPLDAIKREDVEAFMAACRRKDQSPKSIQNYLGLLHGIFDFAMKRGWANANPCKLVDKPRTQHADPDIRFLDRTEVDALVAAVPDDALGRVEAVLYLAAAMTGMRQGELFALRWMDVDWPARRVRVRRNFVRGEFGTPKSKRSSRSVPLADVLGGALDRHYQASAYKGDGDLVFAHPQTGKPLDRSKVLKRYKAALKRAGVRAVRFHDLRHTFGTRMAAAGVPMRTLQEWMGHKDFATTLIYADYAPSAHEADLVDAAFGAGTNPGTKLNETDVNSDDVTPDYSGAQQAA